jgi:hypothetical protein
MAFVYVNSRSWGFCITPGHESVLCRNTTWFWTAKCSSQRHIHLINWTTNFGFQSSVFIILCRFLFKGPIVSYEIEGPGYWTGRWGEIGFISGYRQTFLCYSLRPIWQLLRSFSYLVETDGSLAGIKAVGTWSYFPRTDIEIKIWWECISIRFGSSRRCCILRLFSTVLYTPFKKVC